MKYEDLTEEQKDRIQKKEFSAKLKSCKTYSDVMDIFSDPDFYLVDNFAETVLDMSFDWVAITYYNFDQENKAFAKSLNYPVSEVYKEVIQQGTDHTTDTFELWTEAFDNLKFSFQDLLNTISLLNEINRHCSNPMTPDEIALKLEKRMADAPGLIKKLAEKRAQG